MKKRIFVSTMVIGVLLLTALFVQAMNDTDRFAGGPCVGPMALCWAHGNAAEGGRLEMMATILDLSSEQQAQIKQLYVNARESRTGLRQQMRQARRTLHELMQARPFNESAFRTQAKQLADQRIERMVAQAKIRQQVFTLLTPQQQQKADKLWSMRDRRHRGYGMKY